MDETEHRIRVLIVEDERIIAIDMRRRLEKLGYEVVGPADTAEEALALASSTKPDLILMDIRLKGDQDGLEAAEAIRRTMDIPVVYSTSYTDNATLSRAKASQAMGYIVKPFRDREVLIAIEMALYRHRMEAELRTNRELLNSTLQAIGDGVVAVDRDGRVSFMNRGAAALLGIAAEKAIGRPFDHLCKLRNSTAPRFVGELHAGGPEAAAGDQPAPVMILATAGGSRPVQCVYQPINAQGDGTVVVLRDLTETLRAEANRTRLAAIVANSADAIYSVDTALLVRSWNLGAELLYGYTAEEMIGSGLKPLFPGQAEYREFQELVGLIGSGCNFDRFESPRRCRSGKMLTVSVSLAPIRSELEGDLELACIERDVSAEREREAALRAAKVLAEEANQAKSDFLANVSHELRTPLNGILGMVEISRGLDEPAEREEYLGIAHHQAGELLFLINSLLDFSQLEVGKMHLEARAFSPAACAQACVEHMAPEFRAKGLEFTFLSDASLPELLLGDEHRIAQIIHHLLSNAVKFTPRGSVRLDLDALDGGQPGIVGLRIRVADTGIGIPSDRLGIIWDKFTQLDGSRTRSYGGTGMGLALVKSLTELLGGTVGVTSVEDSGSEFTVVLPLTSPGGSATPKT